MKALSSYDVGILKSRGRQNLTKITTQPQLNSETDRSEATQSTALAQENWTLPEERKDREQHYQTEK